MSGVTALMDKEAELILGIYSVCFVQFKSLSVCDYWIVLLPM
jgi:hypothetical protein